MIVYCFAELAARPKVKAKLKYNGFLSAKIFPQFGANLVDKGLALTAALALL